MMKNLKQWSRGRFWSDSPIAGLTLRCAHEGTRMWARRINWFRHDFWVIDYTETKSGEFASENNRAWRERDSKTAHLYPIGFAYGEKISTPCVIHSAFIGFLVNEPGSLKRLIGRKGFGEFRDDSGKIGDCMRRVAPSAKDDEETGYWKTMSALCDLMTVLTTAKETEEGLFVVDDSKPDFSEQDELVTKVDAYLAENLDRRVTLREIAKAAHISLSTLTHRYTKATNEPPLTAHMRMRIDKAKQLLMLGDSVKNISFELGFGDIYHFSKTFKRMTGSTPSAFRHMG